MADAIKNILFLLLSQKCFDEYFVKFNFFDGMWILFWKFWELVCPLQLYTVYLTLKNPAFFLKYLGPCFKSTVSKGLGLGIIAGSILVKVPQILKIVKNKSAEGINFYGVCMELFAISATIAYSFVNSFPFRSVFHSTVLRLYFCEI